MYSKTYLSGTLINLATKADESGYVEALVEINRSVSTEQGPVVNKAEVLLLLQEKYEEFVGKLAVGDYIFCAGQMIANQYGSPIFIEDIPHFVMKPWTTRNLGVMKKLNNSDELGVIVVGNLGRDPEMRYTPAGLEVTSINVASSSTKKVKGQDVKETVWWKVSLWGKQAINANEMLHKGERVLIEGSLQFDPEIAGPRIWVTKDGENRATFEVSATNFRMLGKGGSDHNAASREQEYGSMPTDDEGHTEDYDDDKDVEEEEEEPKKTSSPTSQKPAEQKSTKRPW